MNEFMNNEVQENEVVENTTENNDVVAVAADNEQPQGLTTGQTVGGLTILTLAGYGAFKITKKVFIGDKKHNEPSLVRKGWDKIKSLRKKKEEPKAEEAQEVEQTAE